MKLLWGILVLFATGKYVQGVDDNQTVVKQDICQICDCNVKEKFLNCANENLYKLFNVKDWDTVISANKSAALANVDFDNNGIEIVTQFPTLEIHTLSLRRNKIRKIEKRAFYNLTLLEKLDLSDNKLTHAAMQRDVFEGHYNQQELEPLINLKWLSLAGNDLHTLDPDLFDHLPNLETLLLCHNQFAIMDANSAGAISSIPHLKVLDLSFMELRKIPETTLHGPRELKVLNLTGNLFTEIPDDIRLARNLVELVMDDVPIVHIGGNYSRFPRLPKLETLSLSFMSRLVSIEEGAFENLPALRHLSIRSNMHFSSIHPHAFANPDVELQPHVEWPPLQSLILYNNNLSTISEKLLERWDDIEEIDIRYNPWKCACENQWMVDKLVPIIKNKSKNPSMSEDVKCDHPVEMKGRSFTDMSLKHVGMRCEDYYGRHPERDGPILVGVFIGLMVGIPVTMAALFVYRRGCFGIFGYRPSPADYGRAFYKRTELRENLHI
ncbi:leucine-rich repeat neuronal protein 2-like [Sitodiplosis mosellana]|uniref:leucine-rich repeat neuronal protein 2-like n=1 Tax=Sitodiplosis mosellana TaxID=263140 RepID=UPI002444D428|nr:leucine-rich repeat neuronal protein 2-like [Sitodiplosis mosellana]